jgi:hypothetical protein
MNIIDPGHAFRLNILDGHDDPRITQTLIFVKRQGAKFPGNEDHYPGTTSQEVLRALIARAHYVTAQEYHYANSVLIKRCRELLFELELRAAYRHGRVLTQSFPFMIEKEPTCSKCGHIQHLCPGAVYVPQGGRE